MGLFDFFKRDKEMVSDTYCYDIDTPFVDVLSDSIEQTPEGYELTAIDLCEEDEKTGKMKVVKRINFG